MRSELLDGVDRFDVDDNPGLLVGVRRTERDTDPPKRCLDCWSCAACVAADVSDNLARTQRREALLDGRPDCCKRSSNRGGVVGQQSVVVADAI